MSILDNTRPLATTRREPKAARRGSERLRLGATRERRCGLQVPSARSVGPSRPTPTRVGNGLFLRVHAMVDSWASLGRSSHQSGVLPVTATNAGRLPGEFPEFQPTVVNLLTK